MDEINGRNRLVVSRLIDGDNIWLSTTNGILLLNGNEVIEFTPDFLGTRDAFVTGLDVDSSGQILASVFGVGVIVISSDLKSSFTIGKTEGLEDLNCLDVVSLVNSKLLVTCGDSLYQIDSNFHSVNKLTDEKLPKKTPSKMTKGQNGNIYLGSKFGEVVKLNFLDELAVTNVESRQDIGQINEMLFSVTNHLYVSSKEGLFIFEDDKLASHLRVSSFGNTMYDEIFDVLELDENRLLVSTYSDGVYEYNLEKNTLSRPTFFTDYLESDALSDANQIFKTNQGQILLTPTAFTLAIIPSSYDFLKAVVNGKTFKRQQAFIHGEIDGKYLLSDGKNIYTIQNNQLISIADNVGYTVDIFEHKNEVLISTLENGLGLLNGGGANFQTISHKGLPSHDANEYAALNSTRDERLIVGIAYGEDNGLYVQNENEVFEAIVRDIQVINIVRLDEKFVVQTLNSGIYFFDMNLELLKHIKMEGYHLNCLKKFFDGKFLVCTRNSGVFELDVEKESIKTLSKLSTARTGRVRDVEYMDGILWLATNRGLSAYSIADDTIYFFDISDGVLARDFNYFSLGIIGDSSLLYISLQDFQIITTKEASDYVSASLNEIVPITKVSISPQFEETIILKHNSEDGESIEPIMISSDADLIDFELFHSNFNKKGKISFEYLVEGISSNWNRLIYGQNRFQLTTLPYGSHIIRVRTHLPQNKLEQPSFSLVVNVPKPWWLHWIALILYGVLMIMLAYFLYLLRINTLKRRNIALEKTVAERTSTIKVLLDKKRAFFANVSHEFRTPLALISGPVNIIEKQSSSAEVSKQVSIVKRNTNRLVALVDQILELAKLETSKTIPNQIYDVQDTVNVVCSSFESLLDNKKQSLVLDSNEKVTAELLQDSLEKILINLLSNAFKYCPDDSQINVSVALDSGRLRLDVADNGPGIAEEQLEAIFERFTRLNQGEDIQGSGIGLALVKELVEANGGTIEVQSIVGSGTNFVIYLPTIKQDSNTVLDVQSVTKERVQTAIALQSDELFENSSDKEPTKSSPTLEEAQSNAKPKLLIVEDNADLRTFIRDILADKYDCYLANNGEEGVSRALELVPNIILSDVLMPKMDGFDLAHAIRDEELICHVPLVLLTAKGDDESRMKGWRENVDDFIAKPFNPDELHLRIERLLSIREIMRKKVAAELGNHLAKKNDNPISFQSKRDLEFFNKFEKVIESHYADEDFNRSVVANALALSERQLNRKLSAMMDYNFAEYLRKFRLQKAHDYILQGRQITEVAYDVGFASPSYFASCFKAEFGLAPREYVEQKMQEKNE